MENSQIEPQYISLDIENNKTYQYIYSKQYDEGRNIIFDITQNGEPFDLTGIIATFQMKKTDDTVVVNDCTITDNRLSLVLTNQMTICFGKMPFQIQLIKDKSVITTITGYLKISESVIHPEDVVSSDEFNALTHALIKVNSDYTYVMESAQASADAAKLSETNAKTSEINVKSSESKAKTSETNAKNSEIKAKTSETNAKASETSASNSASSASDSASIATTKATEASDSASEALSSKNASKISETNAKNSETNSKNSEINAKSSEDSALESATLATAKASEASTSANNANTSANKAKTSETNAKSSETNAKVSENNAYSSALNAKTSETNASASASTASTKATEASTSASNAKKSETNASNSATSASNSASSATSSANTAISKATEASNSATSASNSASTATTKANEATNYALKAESFAQGGTGTRENEDVSNTQYYYEQVKQIAEGLNGTLLPMGTITFSQLINLPVQSKQSGYMYNISNEFTTDDTFKEGAGFTYPAGTNVYYTYDGYWDCLAGTMVTGIKGNAESSYRKGNVNITTENIGAVSIGGDIADNIVTFTSDDCGPNGDPALLEIPKLTTGEKLSSLMQKVSRIANNFRYFLKMLGTTDISAIGDGTVTGGLVTLNDNLDYYINAPRLELYNATGVISSYKVTKYFACCTMEITPTKLEHDSLLAWGLWGPDRQLFLTLPTIGGGNIPCTLTTNGELRVYYANYTTLERIDFTFMYPYKR